MTDSMELLRLRREVDLVDLGLIDLLATRQRLIVAAAAVRGDRAPIQDLEREAAVLAGIEAAAPSAGLSPEIALPVWTAILEASLGYERRIRSGGPALAENGTCCGACGS